MEDGDVSIVKFVENAKKDGGRKGECVRDVQKTHIRCRKYSNKDPVLEELITILYHHVRATDEVKVIPL